MPTLFMPFEERDRINRMYDDLHNACIDAVKILQKLFKLPYDLKYDGIKLVPDKSVIEKEIRKNFIVPLTDEQREYFTLIASVHNAIADLNQYETEHKLNEFSVRGYSDISNVSACMLMVMDGIKPHKETFLKPH
jgi:hypothetical protein